MKKSYVTNHENVVGMINYNTNIINKYIKMLSPPLWDNRKYSKTKKYQQL